LTRQIAHTDDLGPAAEHGASWFCTSKMPGEPVRLRPDRAERSTNEGG
jgi:hypothetical protein